jgi:hypothetical protein
MSDNPGSNTPPKKGMYDSNGAGSSRPKMGKRAGIYDRPERTGVSPLMLLILAIVVVAIIVVLFLFVLR